LKSSNRTLSYTAAFGGILFFYQNIGYVMKSIFFHVPFRDHCSIIELPLTVFLDYSGIILDHFHN